MNRIKYENYLGAAGYDAVARRKIKELEEKVGTGGGSGGTSGLSVGFFMVGPNTGCSATYAEIQSVIIGAVTSIFSGDYSKLGAIPSAVLVQLGNPNPALHSIGIDFTEMEMGDAAVLDATITIPNIKFVFYYNGTTTTAVLYKDNSVEIQTS